MAGLCAAAMVGSMVVPVWASDDAAEEEADGDVADVTEALVGLWKDSAGDIYGFYNDYSFFGQWVDEEQDVLGAYALASVIRLTVTQFILTRNHIKVDPGTIYICNHTFCTEDLTVIVCLTKRL